MPSKRNEKIVAFLENVKNKIAFPPIINKFIKENKRLSKKDRPPYLLIVLFILFVGYIIFYYPPYEFDAYFVFVLTAIIVVAVLIAIFTIGKYPLRKKKKKRI